MIHFIYDVNLIKTIYEILYFPAYFRNSFLLWKRLFSFGLYEWDQRKAKHIEEVVDYEICIIRIGFVDLVNAICFILNVIF